VGQDASYFYQLEAENGSAVSPPSLEEFGTTLAHPGYAVNLDGVNQFYHSDSTVGITGTASRTLEMWVNFDTTSAALQHPASYGALLPGEAFGFYISAFDELFFYGENADYNTGYVFTDNAWHHLAATYDGTTVRTYVDGVETPISAQNIALNTTDGLLYMGAKQNTTAFFTGSIDEVKVWDFVKTDFSDRFDLTAGNTAGLVMYYPFDENIVDSKTINRAVTGFNATPNNSPIYIESLADAPTNLEAVVNGDTRIDLSWDDFGSETGYILQRATTSDFSSPTSINIAPDVTLYADLGLDAATTYYYRVQVEVNGLFSGFSDTVVVTTDPDPTPDAGNALDFDGGNDHISLLDPGYTFGNAITLEAWIKVPDFETGGAIISHFNTAGNFPGFSWEIGATVADAKMEFFVNDGGGSHIWLRDTDGPALNDDIWHHVAISYDGTIATFYVDGNQTTQVGGGVPVGEANNNIYIGRDSNPSISRPLDAQIDEVRIWTSVRSEAEIQNNKDNPLSGLETGLFLYYDFNQGVAFGSNSAITTVTDSSPNGRV
jgi:hypothetical protein